MKQVLLTLLAGVSLLTGNLLFAHAGLTKSSPAEGAVANAAPETIELEFTEDVRLLRFAIAGSDGKALATGFEAAADVASRFAIDLPELAQDSYTVSWAIMGADGHLVEKSFAFTVDADAQENSGLIPEPTAPAAHAH
jgi:methionine-rich copper-binding protein CopC